MILLLLLKLFVTVCDCPGLLIFALTMCNNDPMFDAAKDIELVRNAMYVEPKDQSAWVYYDWLIHHLCLSSRFFSIAIPFNLIQCDSFAMYSGLLD